MLPFYRREAVCGLTNSATIIPRYGIGRARNRGFCRYSSIACPRPRRRPTPAAVGRPGDPAPSGQARIAGVRAAHTHHDPSIGEAGQGRFIHAAGGEAWIAFDPFGSDPSEPLAAPTAVQDDGIVCGDSAGSRLLQRSLALSDKGC